MKAQEDKTFQRAIIASGILHLVLLLVFFFGFPSMFEKLPEEENVMTFEVLPMSELNNIKTENIVAKKAIEPEKSKEVKKSATAKKEDPKPAEEKIEEKKDPVKEEEKPKEAEKIPEKEIVKQEEEKKEPEKKVEPPVKEEVKKEPPKPKVKPKIAPKEDDSIDSILKNLEDESIGTDSKALKKSNAEQIEGTKKTRGMEYNEESPLSITEKSYIKNQIEKNWRPPIGAQNLSEVRVLLHMVLEKDGTVKDVTVVKIACPPNSADTCKLTAESAVRAIKQASPIENLSVDRYDLWKEFNLIFDPSSMDQ